ncbi:phosphotransferase [Salinicola sp. JS01]|uniref:phosphotransferase n=1 Tax=Salinicola sp. JS01 TaxID=3050071 RepID=UPI00255BF3E6|nr:phosphotransferase [Salinicola sp. JS01]WIX32629.1 phosphotransferase [Salinicola sp. JS01]
MTTTDTATQLEALRAQLAALDEPRVDLRHMPDTGLAHDHVWITRRSGPDWVARLPKQSQMQLGPEANLDFQAHCFRRASASGHTPTLHGRLPIGVKLPRGGLLVTAIPGRPARLPEDLHAIAEALAAIHRLPLPAPAERPPLSNAVSPWQAMRDEILAQARYLDTLPPDLLDATARGQIDTELTRLVEDAVAVASIDAHRCLISFDTHPGNFLITPEGEAVLVDLEKCRYSHPGFDLAHATLYTSTTWDPASHAVLNPESVVRFYRQWQSRLGADNPLTDDAALLATRRAMWLWSITWCAKWWNVHRREHDALACGEDWSTSLSDPTLIAHVADRVAHYLSTPVVTRIVDETRYLQRRLAFSDALHGGDRTH